MKSSKNEKEVFVVDDEENASEDISLSEKEATKQSESFNKELKESFDKEIVEFSSDNEAENFVEDFSLNIRHAKNSKKSSDQFEAMITTIDNPFDPFEQFNDWFRYDEEKGYHTCSYLGRIAQTNDEMSDEEFSQAVEKAIDQIIKYDFMNIYKKVKRPIQEEDKTVSKEAVEL